MDKFTTHKGKVAPLDRPNVDTDAIIPKQYLKSIKRSGFGVNLFDDWRYLDPGAPGMDNSRRRLNPDFVLNKTEYKAASILLARENFGCGSSREHAVWALVDFGIRAVLAPSFADIFFNNSFKNGLLPIVLAENIIDKLFVELASGKISELEIDLKQQLVKTAAGDSFNFEIDEYRKFRLINGLDDIGISMQYADEIKKYEDERRRLRPWLFEDLDKV